MRSVWDLIRERERERGSSVLKCIDGSTYVCLFYRNSNVGTWVHFRNEMKDFCRGHKMQARMEDAIAQWIRLCLPY